MRILLAALMSLCLVAPAFALGGGAGGGGEREGSSSSGASNRLIARFNLFGGSDEDDGDEEEEERTDPREISMPAIVAPLQSNNRLTGFAYVTVSVRLRDGADIWHARENAHYALDRLVRASFRQSISNPDGTDIDRELAESVWADALSEYYGANVLDYVEVRSADTRMVQH